MSPIPTFTLVNRASKLPFDLGVFAKAMQEQIQQLVLPKWGRAANIIVAEGGSVPAGTSPVYFLDNTDQADAEGYHQYLHKWPQGFVFVETTLKAGDDPQVTGGHEVLEMLLDPNCRGMLPRPGTGSYDALEICDAVEEDVQVLGGVKLSNFVTPAWFGLRNHDGSRAYDILGKCTGPFEIRPGGYMSIWQPGRGWTEEFGSEASRRHVAAKTKYSRYHTRRSA